MAVHKPHIVTPSSSDPLDETFLTEKELAARHKRSPKTLRNDRVKGSYIEFLSLTAHCVRYRFSMVLAYEQAHRVVCGDKLMEGFPVPAADPREETFLTPRELAKRHHREEKTLRNDRTQRRYISFYKLGGQVRYALSDVLAYEHAHRATSTTSARANDGQKNASPGSNEPVQDCPHDF